MSKFFHCMVFASHLHVFVETALMVARPESPCRTICAKLRQVCRTTIRAAGIGGCDRMRETSQGKHRLLEHDAVTDLDGWGLVVVDMQNDFIAAGGYYARRTELDEQVAQRKLTMEARNQVLSNLDVRSPGKFACPDRNRYRRLWITSCRVIEYARSGRRPIAYVRAIYDREFDVRPPSLLLDPERSHYPCKPRSWGAALIEPIAQFVGTKTMDRSRT